jgi:ribosomal protein S18 acetylase RimI-like enzyme
VPIAVAVSARASWSRSRHSTEAFGAERFVIVAEAGYHALGLYESLGFERREQVAGAWLMPPSGDEPS